MSKSSRVPAHRSRTKEPGPAVKMAAVQAVADSTQERTNSQRKSTRITKRKAQDPDASDDSNLVSGSHIHRAGKASNKRGCPNEKYMPDKKEPISMGRQIPLTFTAQGKRQCAVTAAESSTTLPVQTVMATEVDGDKEDSNILMREWLERKADKGDLPGLQWHDKARKLVKISWKHGSKSGWTASDSQVFISWARCTGRYEDDCKGGFKRWKANFRCALNSLPDVEEVPEESGMKNLEPYKVYRLLDPVSHRRSRRSASDPVTSRYGHNSMSAPGLSAETYQAAMVQSFSAILQSSSAIDEPPNPSDVRFAGWVLPNGEPLVGQEQVVTLQQLASAAHIVHMGDHSYADNSTTDRMMAQRINVALTPIPTMVEHLNGESSDEDEDSEAESNGDNCSVHSTTATAGRSNPPRRRK